MALMTALVVGILFSSGIYMVLQRNLFEILLGVALMGHGTNVLLISMSGWHARHAPPILDQAASGVQYVDPLPHALILTAIVIGFGLLSFLMVLAARIYEIGHDIQATEKPDAEVSA